jgi:hypothetical protein
LGKSCLGGASVLGIQLHDPPQRRSACSEFQAGPQVTATPIRYGRAPPNPPRRRVLPAQSTSVWVNGRTVSRNRRCRQGFCIRYAECEAASSPLYPLLPDAYRQAQALRNGTSSLVTASWRPALSQPRVTCLSLSKARARCMLIRHADASFLAGDASFLAGLTNCPSPSRARTGASCTLCTPLECARWEAVTALSCRTGVLVHVLWAVPTLTRGNSASGR